MGACLQTAVYRKEDEKLLKIPLVFSMIVDDKTKKKTVEKTAF